MQPIGMTAAVVRGTTLVELLIGLVIIAVAMLALAVTLPLLTSLTATEDAEEFAREGRSCAEVLLAVDRGSNGLDLEGQCTGSGVDPSSWGTDAGSSDALEAVCGQPRLALSCFSIDATDDEYYEIHIERSQGGMTPLVLQFPVEQ